MMTFVWWALLVLFLVLGFLGCFINKIPGPVMVVLALLVAIIPLEIDISWGTFALVAALAIVSIISSKILVKLVKKLHEYSKRASWGIGIGSIIGIVLVIAAAGSIDELGILILVAILGFIVIPFLLAFLLELTNKQGAVMAVKCAGSATGVYLADTLLKLAVLALAVKVSFFN